MSDLSAATEPASTSGNAGLKVTMPGRDGTAFSSAEVGDFIALLKPRVMSLVVFTGIAGMLLAPGGLHPVLAVVAVLCIAVGAGASGAINMWYDRDIDALMRRTRGRPVPKGRVRPEDALAFGIVLSLVSLMVMYLAVNAVAAILLGVTIGFYVFIYTMWLKRRTPQNIVIGGAAGALPPMIGWACITGDVSMASISLFAIIFMWTPPHFWALSLYRQGDYAAAGVPMLPVVAGPDATRRQMLLYTLLLVPFTVAPYVLGVSGPVYLAGVLIADAIFVLRAVQVWREKSDNAAKAMFRYSIIYLFLVFGLLVADGLHGPFA